MAKTDWGMYDTVMPGDMNEIGQEINEALANGSANDNRIGDRTISDTTAPTGNTGKLTTLLGWLAYMIKSITGKTNWRTAPATTLEAAKTHMDDTTKHITAAERTGWNAKASTSVATSAANGLMSSADKTKLDGIAANANNYTHPANHPPSIIAQDASNRFVTDAEKTTWNAKANTTVATSAANGLMSAADKSKLDGVAAGANNYSHPATHPPSIIAQDANNRFVTDAEKIGWNAKASTSAVTTSASGLMSAADKSKLDGIAAGANNYTHPATHPPSIIVQDANNRFMTDAERNKLSGVATGANNYTHPATHPPSIIAQDANNRFVTDAEKANWNAKISEYINVSNGTDLNTLGVSGIYRLNDSHVNAPDGGNWGMLFVTSALGAVGHILISQMGQVFTRACTYYGTPGQEAWSKWERMDSKNEVFAGYPHISEGVVYVSSPDFSQQTGFGLTVLSSINTEVNQVSMNGTIFPIVNEGEYSVSLSSNGVFTFVYSHGHFFLRRGGGGEGKLNVFTGTSQPTKKEGIWIQSSQQISSTVIDQNIFLANKWNDPVLNPIPDMPISVVAPCAEIIDGVAYVIGGQVSNNSTTGFTERVFRYNTKTKVWSESNAVPRRLAYAGSFVHGRNIYVVGGAATPNGSGSAALNCFNVDTQTWSVKANAPTPLTRIRVEVVGNFSYVFSIGSAGTNLWVYNILSDSWSAISSIPFNGQSYGPVAAVGAQIYLMSTWGVGTAYKYNTLNGTWSAITKMPLNRQNTPAVAVGTNIYIFGGNQYTSGTGTMMLEGYIYNTLNDSWAMAPNMPSYRVLYGIVFHDGMVYMFGGTDASGINFNTGFSVLAYSFTEKAYSVGTVVVFRADEMYGKYRSELISPAKSLGGRILSHFDDAFIRDSTGLRGDLPTYYGNGSAWVKFKN